MIEIRLARPDEIEAVLALWAEATNVRANDTRENLEVVAKQESLLIAVDQGRIVGTVIAAWDGWRGNIYRVAVAPDHRRRGIGTALVAEAEKRLRASGAPRASILVDGDDEQATAFWSSIEGVRIDVEVRRYLKELD